MRLDNISPVPGDRDRTDSDRGLSGFRAALEERGFTVRQEIDSAVTLNASTLAEVDVLILGSNNRRFAPAEANAVKAWVEAGGGLVAWSDSAFGGDWRQVGVGNPTGARSNNDLTEQFGMIFLRDNGKDYSGPATKNGRAGITRWLRPHFINNHQTNGMAEDGLVIYGEGVSFVRIDPASGAEMLARPQNHGTNTVQSADAPFNPATDAAVAVNQVGAGRVVGVFDRNLFWNDGEGTDLFEVDNRRFAQRIVEWAAIPEPGALGLMAAGALTAGRRLFRPADR
jgi:hypothetical protein